MLAGPFETHLTLDGLQPADWEPLALLAEQERLKLTCIELTHGLYASQPMLTHHGSDHLVDELAIVSALSILCRLRGWEVVRTKIEVGADHPLAPSELTGVEPSAPGRYFENHVKILHAPDALPAVLEEMACAAGARLSRNARRIRSDGQHERFLTQRFYNSSRESAARGLQALLQRVDEAGFTILEHEAEYVIHDTNIGLDAGWMEAPQPGP